MSASSPVPPGDATALASELARTQAELTRLQRLFRSAFGHQFQFMAILSPEGRLIDFNDQFAPGPTVPREQVLGRLFWDTVWWRDDAAMVAAWPQRLRDAALAAGPLAYEDRFTSSQGEPRWAEAAVHAVRDEAGRIDCFVVQATDVTEQRRAAALQQEVEARLREAQKLQAIGTLAGGIAHDFNNILGAIRGNVVLAAETLPADHAARPALAQIERASRRGRSLVRQILAFSRNEGAELRVQPLQPVVEEAVALLRTTLPAPARLETRIDAASVWAEVDASQMHQVLMNLCTNAWQALPGGGGRIEVGLGRALDGGAHLWVRDDGAGMDEATRQRAFEPFFTTKASRGGTGLGLSVVHGIVAHHRGTLSVDTAPGHGTAVHVRLPPADAPRDAGESAPARLEAPAEGGGRHVLYLDDDETMTPLAAQLLQRAGFRVTAHVDSSLALQALATPAHGVDALVTDFNMPGRNGLEVIRVALSLAPGLPIVLTSGYIDDALRDQARQLGVRYLLRKENLLEELCQRVRQALDAA